MAEAKAVSEIVDGRIVGGRIVGGWIVDGTIVGGRIEGGRLARTSSQPVRPGSTGS